MSRADPCILPKKTPAENRLGYWPTMINILNGMLAYKTFLAIVHVI
jgi:hypothetical protein